MTCFPLISLFSTDATLQCYCYFQGKCSVELHCLVPPVQTFTAGIPQPTFMKLNPPHLCSRCKKKTFKQNVPLSFSPKLTLWDKLPCDCFTEHFNQRSIIVFPPYAHNLHFLTSSTSFSITILLNVSL